MKSHIAIAIAPVAASASAATVTFNEHIVPIVYRNARLPSSRILVPDEMAGCLQRPGERIKGSRRLGFRGMPPLLA
jgi:hypothetical protein